MVLKTYTYSQKMHWHHCIDSQNIIRKETKKLSFQLNNFIFFLPVKFRIYFQWLTFLMKAQTIFTAVACYCHIAWTCFCHASRPLLAQSFIRSAGIWRLFDQTRCVIICIFLIFLWIEVTCSIMSLLLLKSKVDLFCVYPRIDHSGQYP